MDNTRHSCFIFMVQSPLSSPLLLILGNRDCSSKPQCNHYTQSRMIFAESFTKISDNLFLPISHLGSFQPTMALVLPPGILVLYHCNHVPIHRASITPKEIPIQSGHTTREKGKNRQLLTLLSSSFTTYIH